jgi:hypothetical protein
MNDEGRPKTAPATHPDCSGAPGGRLLLDAQRRAYKALLLSPTLHVFEAVIRGERVPLDRLDPVWVGRLGLRSDDEPAGVIVEDFNSVAATALEAPRVVLNDRGDLTPAGGDRS